MDEPSARREFLNPIKAIRAFREESAEQDLQVPTLDADVDASRDDDCLLYVARQAMACTFQVYFATRYGDGMTEAAIEALELVEQLENQMTVYRSSPLTHINETAGKEPIRVESRLFDLLQKGIELYQKTGGAFDMTSGLLTRAWGFFRKEGRIPNEQELESVLQSVGSDKVHLDAGRQTVAYASSDLEINLGGIGKGYALDRVAECLEESGSEHFLIHGGQSSVLARGDRLIPEENHTGEGRENTRRTPWKVGLRHPVHADRRIAEIVINNRALGTSGTARQSFYYQGRKYGHIIDPRTGQPCSGVYSATALAPTAAEADALATAFYVMGGAAATDFCRRFPAYACLVLSPGKGGEVRMDREGLADEEVLFPERASE